MLMTGSPGTKSSKIIKVKAEYLAVIGLELGYFVAELMSDTEKLANQRCYLLGMNLSAS
jgi:hypothetical protein